MTASSPAPGAVADAPGAGRREAANLALATAGFLISFWAWAQLSPLAPG
ncbi:MAG: MFS transporter, partial [Micromonosporaceae bacterium]|nr:MFS transporter [Micromonosporaceae bacterium]